MFSIDRRASELNCHKRVAPKLAAVSIPLFSIFCLYKSLRSHGCHPWWLTYHLYFRCCFLFCPFLLLIYAHWQWPTRIHVTYSNPFVDVPDMHMQVHAAKRSFIFSPDGLSLVACKLRGLDTALILIKTFWTLLSQEVFRQNLKHFIISPSPNRELLSSVEVIDSIVCKMIFDHLFSNKLLWSSQCTFLQTVWYSSTYILIALKPSIKSLPYPKLYLW